ncbi:MAG: hypothetical protein ABI337_03235 [Nitrososphaera sp.]|jgi:hypothetical protein
MTSILMFSTVSVLLASLALYVSFLTPSAFDSSAAGADQLESQYIEKAKQTVFVLDSVSGDAKSLGGELWVSGMSVRDVIEKINEMKTTIHRANSELKGVDVPSRFSESHVHLVSATDGTIRSFDSLEDAFSKFEELRSKPPLYYTMLILNSDDTTFYQLSQMFMLNETERVLINDAKLSFANSILEADYAQSELEMFLSTSELNASAMSQGVVFYETYRPTAGGCAACSSPINEILK